MVDISWPDLVKLAKRNAPDQVMRIRSATVLRMSQAIIQRDATIQQRDGTIQALTRDLAKREGEHDATQAD